MNNLKIGTKLKGKGSYSNAVIVEKTEHLFAMKCDGMSPIIWLTPEQLKELFILPEERWTPKYGDSYWYVSAYGAVAKDTNINTSVDTERIAFNNYFKTEKDAEVALEKVRKVLAGG